MEKAGRCFNRPFYFIEHASRIYLSIIIFRVYSLEPMSILSI